MSRLVPRALSAALAVAAAFGAVDSFAQVKYTAEVRRTSYGIAHIKASDFGSVGYGVGYAFAQDNFCTMADEFLTVRGERSKYLGGTGSTPYGVNNVFSDLFYTYFNGDAAVLTAGLAKMKPEVQAAFKGWAAGFNRYLKDTGVANLPAPCKGAPFISPVTDVDMMRLVRRYALQASSGNFIAAMMNTFPPAATAENKAWDGVYDMQFWKDYQARREMLGSNALALGSDATDNGRGMLLGNPHFPWVGTLRFFQFHVTVPGQMDVMGGSLSGFPFINIGFNKDVAWSHTVDKANHFTLFELKLDPTNPRKYVVDGVSKDMTSKTVTVQVRQADGSLAPVSRVIYSSQFGPLLNLSAPLVWGTAKAYAIKDANLENWRMGDQWFDINRATSTLDVEAALDRNLGIPWVNTIAADRLGNAFYGDISTAPNVDRFHQSTCTPDVTMAGVFATLGVPVLDGSRSSCDWVQDASAPQAGLLPGPRMPRVHRSDFVQNSNDNYWMTNPAANLYSFHVPAVVGIVPQQQSNRTRLGVSQAMARLAGADGRPGNKFTLPILQEIALANRSYAADAFLPDMLALCDTQTDAAVVALCTVLKNWDRKFELTSRGAHLFKEFWTRAAAIPNVYTVPFDFTKPLTTPSGLAISNPAVATALVGALTAGAKVITDAGLAVDAPLGMVQFATQTALTGGQVIIPMHGGDSAGGGDLVGVYNKITSSIVPGVGYIVSTGTSYIQTVQFTDSGVTAQGFLSYSQSSNPASPNFADQTAKFAAKQWITLPFTETAITSDPAYRTMTISE
ncbi:MAG: acylase [Betaproteobacteria bacterium]|nr:MAG: acylase [Betaproteobacteria bacterium]